MEITKDYLESLNPTCFGEPKNITDYHVRKANLLKLADTLDGLGCPDKTMSFEQDANHYASVGIGYGSLRFSRFDNLVAITHEEDFPPVLLKKVIEATEQHGFVYVPWHFFGEPFSTRERFNGDLFNQLFDWQ